MYIINYKLPHATASSLQAKSRQETLYCYRAKSASGKLLNLVSYEHQQIHKLTSQC